MFQTVREHNGRNPKPSGRFTRSARASLIKEEKGQKLLELVEAQSLVEMIIL
jgi:hypothetical protein